MKCPACNATIPECSHICCSCGGFVARNHIEKCQTEETVFSESIPEAEGMLAEPNAEAVEETSTPIELCNSDDCFEEPVLQRKRGRLWVPMVILAALFAAGITLFFASKKDPVYTDRNMPWFSIQEGVLYFDPAKYSGSEELHIPETVAGQTVTALSDGCFAQCDNLTTVKLPATLRRIGHGAFEGCDELRGLFVTERVKEIGSNAFYGCKALESVCIPYTVKIIGKDAFSGCDSLYYIFYSGPAASWRQLYSGEINANTHIIAADQTIPHVNRPS